MHFSCFVRSLTRSLALHVFSATSVGLSVFPMLSPTFSIRSLCNSSCWNILLPSGFIPIPMRWNISTAAQSDWHRAHFDWMHICHIYVIFFVITSYWINTNISSFHAFWNICHCIEIKHVLIIMQFGWFVSKQKRTRYTTIDTQR